MNTIQRARYGTIEQTGIMTSGTQRKEIYTRDDDGQKFSESCFVVDYRDHSPRVDNDRESEHYRAYNPACSSCYLGFTHSVNYHDHQTKKD
jgi:hypothetical protein